MLSEAQWDNIQAGDPNPVNDEDWPADEVANDKPPEAPQVVLKPKDPVKPKAKDKTSTQRKKLLRLEPGKSTHLSANVSFAPKKKTAIRPADEEIENELDDEELEEEELEDEDDLDEVEASISNDDEYEEEDGEYEDDDYEDVEEEYEDADYEEEEEE